jgi:HEPN domain-containing protein
MTALDAAKLLLAKALEDETLVVKTLTDTDISDTIIGFHCQQACEKLLKSLLAAINTEYRASHDLGELSVLLKEVGESVPIEMRTLIRLNRFAVKFRYENPEPMVKLDREHALQIVQKIRAWVEERLEQREKTRAGKE